MLLKLAPPVVDGAVGETEAGIASALEADADIWLINVQPLIALRAAVNFK